jgi:hypothetical protein
VLRKEKMRGFAPVRSFFYWVQGSPLPREA